MHPRYIDTTRYQMSQAVHPHYYNKRNASMYSTRIKRVGTIVSLTLNVILLFVAFQQRQQQRASLVGKSLQFRGGHPLDDRTGTCWCSADKYCMCNPSLAIDVVLLSGNDHVWVIRRQDTSQLATVGGFVEVGETVENTVRREIKEELGVDLPGPLKLIGVYSDPRRDNRRHTVSAVFVVEIPIDADPRAADDAKEVVRMSLSDIQQHEFFADHKAILMDYMRSKEKSPADHEGDGTFPQNVIRSTCFD